MRSPLACGRLPGRCMQRLSEGSAISATTDIFLGCSFRLPRPPVIVNTIGTVGGMVCDGAKSSCAAKISTALQTALLGMKMALRNCAFKAGEGLIQDNVEDTIQCFGRMGREGMRTTDIEILNIMLGY